ncbi:MAG: iron-sulfur cluster assembly scaffold protein [Acidobacteriia bacterium]|nr:iron-sulfur cluster assembly scaffold protein [Terriglobia bacterium]
MDKDRGELLRDLGYSEKAIRFIAEDRNFGQLPVFSVKSSHQGQCGDVLRLYLDVDRGVIREASFEHVGCTGLQASAAGVTTMIRGMTLDDAAKLDVKDIVDFLGKIPDAKLDCAQLARDTLRKAIQELKQASTPAS